VGPPVVTEHCIVICSVRTLGEGSCGGREGDSKQVRAGIEQSSGKISPNTRKIEAMRGRRDAIYEEEKDAIIDREATANTKVGKGSLRIASSTVVKQEKSSPIKKRTIAQGNANNTPRA